MVIIFNREPVLAIGIGSALVPVFYLVKKLSYVRAFHFMILTLPFLTAFTVDIGGNMRVPYYFAVIALILALLQGQLRFPRPSLVVLVLHAFVFYAFFSTILILRFDLPSLEFVQYGFRNTEFRPLIQAGQLGLMLVFFYLTVNFLSSAQRLHQLSHLIFWSLVLVVVYGTYEIASVFLDFPFFNINTNIDHIANRFAGTQITPVGGILIPRPRSILLEPLNLASYILFSLPFAVTLLAYEKRKAYRGLIVACAALAVLLFIMAWSRTALGTLLIVIPLTILLVPSWRIKRKILFWGVIAYAAMGLLLFPRLGGPVSLTFPATAVYERLETVKDLAGSLAGDTVSSARLGRGYGLVTEVFTSHPIFGVGLGNYFIAVAEITGGPVQTATTGSLYLQLLAQVGIVGTSLFLCFVGLILWRLFKAMTFLKNHPLRPLALASFISIVGVMGTSAGIAGLTTDSYIWVALAIGMVIPNIMRQMRRDAEISSAAEAQPTHITVH